MKYLDDPRFLRQLIMDHYENPHNKRTESEYEARRASTDSCIDDITVQVLFDNTMIKDICFDGQACTIATSAASIMTDLVKGKSIEEVEHIMREYHAMIELKPYDEEILSEAVAFKNVGRQANRITCATLGWKALRQLIDEREGDQ